MPGSLGQWALVAKVNSADPRILLGSLAVSAGGSPDRSAWDIGLSTNVWRDPAKRWVMPAPLPTTAAWTTTTTGNYARLPKSAYTLTTSAAWVENHRDISGNIFLEANGTNERVTSTASYDGNQAWFISQFVPGLTGLQEQTVLEFGMGTYGGSTTIWFRVRANGTIIVFKGTEQIALSDLDFAQSKQPAGKSLPLSTINLMVIPIRPYKRDGTTADTRGELLIITDAGTAMSVPFEDLGSSDTITPSGVIWWQVPQGRPSVCVAKCDLESSATLYGPAQVMRYAPNTPRTFAAANWVGKAGTGSPSGTTSLVNAASLAAYTPDGTTTTVRVKVAITGPLAVAAIDLYMEPTRTTTYAAEVDILTAIKSLRLSVDDWRNGGKSKLSLSGHYSALSDAGMVGLATQLEWPFRLAIKDMEATTPTEIDIFRGVIVLDSDSQAEGLAHGDNDLLTFSGFDWTYEQEHGSFLDPLANDGESVPVAVAAALLEVGFNSAYIVPSTTSYVIPINDPAQGEWTEIPERGGNIASWVQGLFERHAADWWRGWVPTTAGYLYRIMSPSDLSSSVVATLYASRANAATAGVSTADKPHRVYYSYALNPIAPEANQVIVIGQKRTGDRRLILSQSNITAAQAPATVPASRPNTWTGRVERVIEINPGVTTQAQADDLQAILTTRLAVTRNTVEFEAPFLITTDKARPVWSGDVVRLYQSGGTVYDDVRILSIGEIDFGVREFTAANVDTGSIPIRRASYRGEIIATGP